jgi:hypothetical protein
MYHPMLQRNTAAVVWLATNGGCTNEQKVFAADSNRSTQLQQHQEG